MEIRVLPAGIGDFVRRLQYKRFLLVTGAKETETCGNINLCDVLVYNIEGYVQTTMEDF